MTNIKYIRLELLTSTVSSMIENVETILASKKLNGKGIFLPKKYIKNSNTSLIYIPSKVGNSILEAKEIKTDPTSLKTMSGIFLTPLGLDLSKMLENELKSSTKMDLNYLQDNLPRIIKNMKKSGELS